ncbi:FAD-dependent monooxygenase [Staphylococcus devriesei]|uniref:FAD-dependent monooxygenase n=1 Tax=Staphylococcus devriesei TaxID=586733 RepID=A0A2K4DMT6_9STAP|nr:NAD(P)/FAD-dependent oxidoreductase [Staphylococcus devriesei]MCE5097049.1 FAD-dependent monooxygenase [Staphylococcus devriesei]PNZ88098.1 FAD-dependent monooxygenase [Staphylococcus devriesei]PTE71302.1 FAD-dependent monooxygenase [Staphylococcus devriesei]PTF14902.1 FAD-dependent monooxygenase [Staphylococcus devriesei]PTF17289.1 FAD-dependent monooxygenase [Staphylococcus devriesei]
MNIKDVKRVGIIGGGPGGLMLGLLLQQQGFKVNIFEKAGLEVNADRGGSLDIHEESGQLPLKETGIIDKFKELARFEGEDTRVLDKNGKVYYEETADPEVEGGRPEIDRGELCDLISEQLHDHTVIYDKAFKGLTHLDNNQIEVEFDDASTMTFDFVVGADGAFSKVRPYLANVDVEYNGISMVELNVEDVFNQYPDLAQFNKNGKMMAFGDHKAILGQVNGDGRIKVYMSYRMDYDEFDQFKAMSKAEIKEQLLNDFSDWDADLKKYIEYAGDDLLLRRIYKLPIGFKWENQANLTLIGDAAHLMSPFAGEGVNMAFYDAYLLAKAIKAHDELKDALQAYEATMYETSQQSASESQANLEEMFGDNAAQKFGDFFNQVGELFEEHQNQQ